MTYTLGIPLGIEPIYLEMALKSPKTMYAAAVGREHSRKELFEQRIINFLDFFLIRNIYMSPGYVHERSVTIQEKLYQCIRCVLVEAG